MVTTYKLDEKEVNILPKFKVNGQPEILTDGDQPIYIQHNVRKLPNHSMITNQKTRMQLQRFQKSICSISQKFIFVEILSYSTIHELTN